MNVAQIETPTTPDQLPVRFEPELALVPRATPGERARKLQLEARLASLEHLAALQAVIGETHDMAQTVVEGGDLYDVGIRDLARRLVEDLSWRAKSLEVLTLRQRPAQRGSVVT
jgi:hypothetical protein